MKKLILALFTMIFVSTSIFAQADLQVLTVVKNGKNQTITVKDLKKRVAQISKSEPNNVAILKTVDGRKKALETMIEETLIIQEAQKSGMSIPDSVVEQELEMQFSQLIGSKVTVKQFEELVKKQFNMSLDDFLIQNTGANLKETKENLKNGILVNQYVFAINQEELKKIAPTDDQIRMFYEANKAGFVQKDMQKLFIVSIPKGSDANAAKTKLNQIKNKLADKKTTTEKIVVQAEAENFQAGDMLVQKDQQSAMGIGMTMEQLLLLFTKPVGFISDIIDTPDAYQFFTIVKKYDAKMLSLSDLVQPETTVTVYDYIRMGLTQNLQMQYLNQAMQDLANKLNTPENVEMKKSDEAIEKLLNWGE